jgi:hypothetical protein
MRALRFLAIAALAACSNGIPSDVVVYEVPPPGYDLPPASGTASSYGTGFESGTGPGSGYGASTAPAPTPLMPGGARDVSQIGDDQLNLAQFSLEQQRIDAAAAERDLEAARSQLVIVQPGAVPSASTTANVALFAQQTTNAVGQSIYPRSRGIRISSNCGRYGSGDNAQRAFLAAGGPTSDSLNLDPDGDGFACGWDPAPYRALR